MSKEFKVGLIAVIAGITLYYGFNFLKGVDFFLSTAKYYAIYDNVDGLTKSNPVIINGLTVGRVSQIRLKQDIKNKILVELTINQDIVLGDETVALLSNTDFLGSKGIILEVGSLTNKLEPTDTLISEVDKGIGQILEDATPVANNLNVTISRINDILIGLQGSGEKINDAIGNLNTTMSKVNIVLERNKDIDIAELLASTNELIENLDRRTSQIKPILAKSDLLMDSLNNLRLNQTLFAIERLVDNLNETVTLIQNPNSTVGRLMNDDSLYTNINKTMIDLDKLLIHMDQYPKHFFSPLGKSHDKIKKDLNRAD
ncbi:MAG: phospholipid/cholesterol/gamma-HCH transport system substrate-binding protein [Cyclobacteriaceae bacterium]|jgi:phospholipid/cholesterol/gamma-HCH transport system substrate-binding protein